MPFFKTVKCVDRGTVRTITGRVEVAIEAVTG